MARSSSGDSLLTRVMRVLQVFADTPTATITEIAARADLPLATAHRLVTEMLGYGLLERDDTRRIRMGVRLWEMSLRSHRVLGLREAALPFMEDLQAVVRQHVEIAVLTGTEVLYIERLSAPGSVANIATIARRLPVYACSSGLVLLAHAPLEVQDAVYSGPLEVFTPQSITDAGRLRRVVGTVRRRGYAVAPGLITVGSKGVAAPLRDASGAVVAALSIVVPMTMDHRPVVPALMAAARGISRAMGGATPGELGLVRQQNPLPTSH